MSDINVSLFNDQSARVDTILAPFGLDLMNPSPGLEPKAGAIAFGYDTKNLYFADGDLWYELVTGGDIPPLLVGSFDNTSSIDGLYVDSLNSNRLRLTAASSSDPGGVSIIAQSFAGPKTFIDDVNIPDGNLNAMTITTGSTITSGGAIIAPEAITNQIVTNAVSPKTGSNVAFTSDISGVSAVFSNQVEAGSFYTNGQLIANGYVTTGSLTAPTVNVNTLSPTLGNILTISIPGYASFALKASGSSITTLESAATATRNILLPDASDTLVGKSTTDIFTNKTIIGNSNHVEASSLSTTGDSVSVNTSAPPSVGQVLMASSSTVSTWQTLPVAGLSVIGLVSISSQNFSGLKTFFGGVRTSTQTNQKFGDVPFPSISSGANNNSFGVNSMSNVNAGNSNNGFGTSTLSLITNSNFNSAFGSNCLRLLTTGGQNTGVGRGAGENLASGDGNLFLGYNAGTNILSGNNSIMLGNSGVVGDVNVTRIGIGQDKTFISGISGKTTGGVAVNCVIDANGQLGTVSSLRSLKENIEDLDEDKNHNLVESLITRKFTMKSNGLPSVGLIVDEVPEDSDLLAYDNDGKPYTVRYDQITILLLKEIQRSNRIIKTLQNEVKNLKEGSEKVISMTSEVLAITKKLIL